MSFGRSSFACYRHAAAYYGVLREPKVACGTSDEQVAEAAIRVEERIEARKAGCGPGESDNL